MKSYGFSFLAALSLVAFATSCTEDSASPNLPTDASVGMDTEDASDTAEPDTGPDVEEDIGTPGPTGLENQCEIDSDCKATVQCAEARCLPGTKGNVCMSFPKLVPQNFCDDKDPCTIDICNTEPKTAADYADFGCSHKPRACNDYNPCTANLCDEDEPDGCVFVTDDAACDDQNACTFDFCTPGGGCEHTTFSCDDGLASTEDGCTQVGGCYHNAADCAGDAECSDNDPCTIDFCDPNQDCIHIPMTCDDGIACTEDFCFGGGCIAVSSCKGGDACSLNECNIFSGDCEPVAIDKPDGKECTTDSCHPVDGWSYHKIEGCCVKDSDCQDGDLCKIAVCDTTLNVCASVSIKVDDGIDCTLDSCNINGYVENVADDGLCPVVDGKQLHCSPTKGCVQCSEYFHCNDGDNCTEDACSFSTNTCSNKPKCADPKICVDEGDYSWCSNPQGWCDSDPQCASKSPCEIATCVDNACVYKPVNCDDGNNCTTDACVVAYGGGCKNEWSCDDGNPCTDDSCIDNECKNENNDVFCIACTKSQDCPNGPICVGNSKVEYSGVCNQKQCFHDWPIVCGGNACEDGLCEDGACLQKPKDCSDKDACTKDLCDYKSGCYNLTVDCNDFNPCTIDSCDPDKTCPDGVDFCDPNNGCSNMWDYSGCPWGPEGNPCGNLWDCAPCKYAGCADYPETSDLCIGPPNHVCVHGVEGLYGGVGIKNMGLDIVVDIQPDGQSPTMNLLVLSGDHIYYPGSGSVKIYEISDPKTGEKVGFPPSLACIDTNGNLVIGEVINNVLVCK